MYSFSKFKSFGLALVLAAGISGAQAAEEVKIATVDMQKALQTVDAGKKAKSQFEKELTAVKKQVDGEEAAITKMGEEFKKQSLVMNDEARSKKQAELQERIMKYQESRGRWLQVVRPLGQCVELGTEIHNDLRECQGQNTADDAQHGIGE